MRSSALSTALVVLLAAGVVACRPTRVPDRPALADDVPVVISGRLTMPDGSPAAGVTVGLMDDRGSLTVLLEFAAAVSTVGIMCLARTVGICQGNRIATTGQDGRYSFDLTGKDTKNLFNRPSDFVLSAQLANGDGKLAGPFVSTRFKVVQAEVAVPDLAFWEPRQLAARAGTQWIEYSGAELPGGGGPEYTVAVIDDEELVWSQPGGPEGRLDARAVADLRGALQVSAVTRREVDGVAFTTTHQSHQISVGGTLGPPASRGATCVVAGPRQAVLDRCPVTDGRYRDKLPRTIPRCPRKPDSRTRQESCEADTWLAIDLGETRVVGTLFVHGLSLRDAALVVETSDNGVRWTQRLTVEPARFGQIDLPEGVSARHLRLRSADQAKPLTGLVELSVWP